MPTSVHYYGGLRLFARCLLLFCYAADALLLSLSSCFGLRVATALRVDLAEPTASAAATPKNLVAHVATADQCRDCTRCPPKK